MEKMSFGNDSELVSNYIDPDAMLSHYLNWHRHHNHSNWMAEYRIKIVPDVEIKYGGSFYIETDIIGNGERFTHEQALQIVYDYESQTDPEAPSMEPDETYQYRGGRFESYLSFNRWYELGPSPEYAGQEQADEEDE